MNKANKLLDQAIKLLDTISESNSQSINIEESVNHRNSRELLKLLKNPIVDFDYLGDKEGFSSASIQRFYEKSGMSLKEFLKVAHFLSILKRARVDDLDEDDLVDLYNGNFRK